MCTTGDSIHFVSRFLFRYKWLHYWLEKIYVVVSCTLHRSFFFDNLSSNKTACSSSSASKTKCTVKGAIVRANRKKSEAWVESGKERRWPDLTRPDPKLSRFITPPLLSCRVAFRFVLLNERLERASNKNSN